MVCSNGDRYSEPRGAKELINIRLGSLSCALMGNIVDVFSRPLYRDFNLPPAVAFKPLSMQPTTIETKMSDLQVVQTILDFWDPYVASIYRNSTLNQIDEYDSYSFPILDLLRKNASHGDLLQFLNQTELTRGSLSSDENQSINNFFAWAFLQTWQRHQFKETNIRRLHVDSVQLPDGEYRFMPRLELLQQYLQQWDPLEASKHWLFGADTLKRYDNSSIILDQAVESKDIDEVCFALEMACLTEGDGVAFALENYSLERGALQDRYHSHLIERSKRHKDRAEFLIALFNDPSRAVRRRIQPCKRIVS